MAYRVTNGKDKGPVITATAVLIFSIDHTPQSFIMYGACSYIL